MLSLKNIVKDYPIGGDTVHALRSVDIDFRENEFVAVLGQSGCGKTTLLNIIGGLDKYTSGDLIINGKSTKEFKDRDWDTYRNYSIGFVFQSYNLIPHQTVLSNVELALTLSGVSKAQRRERAIEALKKVGLGDQLHKKPNQMSGGQMQRVAIARALVNDPDILLADEPTGALDSETSVAIMEILKEIAKEKLIIMVTHNPELAEQYATRTIRLLDGKVISDSQPFTIDEQQAAKEAEAAENAAKKKKTSMSFFTAMALSLNNLMTKKGRTFLTSFAGSIGIIGIALILSLSSGVQAYIDRVQEDTLSSYPLQIDKQTIDYTEMFSSASGDAPEREQREHDRVYSNDIMYTMINTMMSQVITNDLRDFKEFLEDDANGLDELVTDIQYRYETPLNVYRADTDSGIIKVNPTTLIEDMYAAMGVNFSMSGSASSLYSSSMSGMGMNVWSEMLDNEELLANQYDVIAGRMPEQYNEVVFIVDNYNGVSDYTMYALGLKDFSEVEQMLKDAMAGKEIEKHWLDEVSYSFDEILGLEFKLMVNTDYYAKENGVWVDKSKDNAYMLSKLSESETIKVVGIIRPSEDAVATSAAGNIGYRSDLMEKLITKVNESEIVKEQKADPEIDVFTGLQFEGGEFTREMLDEYLATLPEEEAAKIQQSIEMMENMGMSFEQIIAMSGEEFKTTATYDGNLAMMGVADLAEPASILIYPKDFEAKEAITDKIDSYNSSVGEEHEIVYTDYIGLLMSSVTTMINAVSYILIAFVAISLIVSSIMIGIITYISVLERTKEIGILRAIGASKKDISRVFNAETLIVGFGAGAIGIGVTLLLNIPINIIIKSITDISGLSRLPLAGGITLVIISMLLTLIAGLIPSRLAAKKDPVIALRTE